MNGISRSSRRKIDRSLASLPARDSLAPRPRGADALGLLPVDQLGAGPSPPRSLVDLGAGLVQADRDDPRDARLLHRHAVETVGRLHRPLVVRDDDELRPLAEVPQQGDEAPDVRVVERRVEFVQDAEGARLDEIDARRGARSPSGPARPSRGAGSTAASCRSGGRRSRSPPRADRPPRGATSASPPGKRYSKVRSEVDPRRIERLAEHRRRPSR